MAPPLSHHVQAFSRLVQTMNQTQSKKITMTADDARNLHSDIFALLAKIAELSDSKPDNQPVTISMDGGSFK